MGLTRSDLFSLEQNELSRVAKAFAHPARIAILQHLLKINACINGDLVEETGLSQATISQHLKELKEVGLIKGNIEGASMSYCINSDRWVEVKHMLTSIFDAYKDPNNTCC